jgi:glutathione peroxidase
MIEDFEIIDIEGKKRKLSDYKDKVLLIVNTASQCGFTKQYEGLEALYQEFKDKDFMILGFPCNQFGKQEPAKEADIKNFCELNYHITFPIFSKIEVNGPKAHPLYVYLKKQAKGLFGIGAIKWNFTKFLINKQGEVVGRFAPQDTPESLRKPISQYINMA